MKKNYLLGIIVIGLISLSLYSTYAMFNSSVETDDIVNLSTSIIPLDSEIVEYERITINAKEAKSIMLNVKNDTEANLYYGAWYEMISPSVVNENIEIAKLTSSEDNTQGLINTKEEKKIKIVIKNTSASNVTLNIGVTYSMTSSLNLPTDRYIITNELPGKYVINVAVVNGSTNEPSKILDVGNSTSISVIPSTGYRYKSVSCTNAEASYNTGNNTLTLTNIIDDVSCTVENEIITYTVGVQASTGGTISGSSSKVVNYNSSTTFTVVPNTGYQYSSVSCSSGITGNYNISNNTLTVSNVTSNGTCTLNFELKTYTVNVVATNGVSNPTTRTVNHGSSTTFTVTPNNGYTYDSLSCTGGSYNSTNNTLAVSNVTSNRTCTINFKPTGAGYIESLFANNSNTMNNDDPDGNIRYMGADPNNYVSFNNELWRIIGVFNVKSSVNGQSEKRIKIVRYKEMSGREWDRYNTNNWSTATLQQYLNGEYYNSLSTEAKNQIQNAYWNIGGVSEYQTILVKDWYIYERGNQVYSGNPTYWIGKIGLIYPSDYGYATSGGKETSTSGGSEEQRISCIESDLYNWDNRYLCYNYNYFYRNEYTLQWTMTHYLLSYQNVFYVHTNGYIMHKPSGYSTYIFPVLYLKSTVKITGGTGTYTNPYTLSQ